MGSQHAVGGFSSPLHINALRALIQEGTHMTDLKTSRRKFLHLAAGAAALPAASHMAGAQAYPTRPVRIIVGFAVGGGADITARLMGQSLSKRLGQQFIVENRPGAGGNIATEAVVNAPADGYTLLLATSPNAVNATLYQKLNFNFIRDISPVASVVAVPLVVVVHPSVPAKTVPEFIAYARANPGKLNMGSGVNMVHVPYRGGAPAVADLLGGQLQVMFDVMLESIEYVRADKLRPLAVTTALPSAALPHLPTVSEFVPGYQASARPKTHPPRSSKS
jgi:tripartite-type tricarboxylate transporter receptor subunit TctC